MVAAPLSENPPADGLFVLLVDDNEDGRDMYREYLTFKGCRVVVAADGAEGVEHARAEHPDIILMDLRMPSMTGYEAIRVLRSDPAMNGVPIVALTAHAMDSERADADAAGFDAVIAKPCLPDDLFSAIHRVLAERSPSEHPA
jgi:two-component system, cell cycle response regulator DivK